MTIHRFTLFILALAASLVASLQTLGPDIAYGYDPAGDASMKNERPKLLDGVGIQEKLGARFSGEETLKDETGKDVHIAQFFTNNRPVVLSMVYYTCPGLCNLHLNGLFEGLKQIDLKPGKDYEMIAVSFEPRDTFEIAHEKKNTYLKTYGLQEYASGIHFLTGNEEQVKTLTKEVGFQYRWDKEGAQWAHASAAILISPQRVITRYLHGVIFEPKTVRLSLIETSQGHVGDLVDKIMLFCFNYSPRENRYALAAFKVMRIAGALTVLLLALWLVPTWIRSRRSST